MSFPSLLMAGAGATRKVPTASYFVLPPYDDVPGLQASMGIAVRSPWQRFLTAATSISVINSLVGGVLAGAVVHDAFTSSDALSFSAGALATLLCFWAFNGFERRTWRRAMHAVPTRFPSPNDQA
jgi:hypothetical protein